MSTSSLPSGVEAAPRRLAGDVAMWFFIMAELAVFASFFAAYGWNRRHEPAVFAEGQQHLHVLLGTLNTVWLVLGSAAAAWAARQAAAGASARQVRRGLLGACAAGLVFVVCKTGDFVWLTQAGFDLDTSDFWMFYFSLTFFHFMHVLLGMVILLYVGWPLRRAERLTPEQAGAVESGAAYWHMVDLVWIVLFALVYIAR